MSVLSACDSLTGWTLDTSGIGTKTIDSTIQTEGAGCIKYVRTVDKARNNQCFLRLTLSSTDFSNKRITFKYRWENAPSNQLKLRILNSTGPVIFNVNIDTDSSNNVWHTASVVIPGTRTAATFIEIYHDGDRFAGWADGATVTLYLDDLQLNDAPAFTGIINPCESLTSWSLDTNGDGVGSIDHVIPAEGAGCIKYARTIDKTRNRTCQLQVWMPRVVNPTGKALRFKYRWDNPHNQLSVRFITILGNAASTTTIVSDTTPDVWHTVTIPLTGSILSQGVDRVQFTNNGDQYTNWADGEAATLYLDDIRIVDQERAPSGVVLSECDDLQLWTLDTNSIGTKAVDTVIKNSSAGSIKHARIVDKFRSGTVAATTNLTSNLVPPSVGDTVTIGSVTYTFVLTLTSPAVANEVIIDGEADTTLANLRADINLSAGSGTVYSTYTVVHPTVSAGVTVAHALPLSAKTVGTGGNSIVTTSTCPNLTFDGSTMSGGGTGVRRLNTTRRLQLSYSSLPSRYLVFDYRWNLAANELNVRFVNTSGSLIPNASAHISTNATPNVWHTARIPLQGADLSKLRYLDFYDSGDLFAGWNDGDEPTLWLDNIRMESTVKRKRRQPAVVIQFDDGYKDNYTIALPIMQKYGQIATIGISTAYTITGFMTGNNQPTLNISEIQALADAGWEICSHTVHHTNMRSSSNATVDSEMTQSKADLEGWGFEVNHFIYPYTQASDYSAQAALQRYSAATVGGPPNQVQRKGDSSTVYGTTDLGRLPRVAMGATSTLEDFKRNVLDGIKNDTLPIIYFHALTAAPGTVYVLPEMFEQMMRWLKLNGVRTLGTTEALREYGYIN